LNLELQRRQQKKHFYKDRKALFFWSDKPGIESCTAGFWVADTTEHVETFFSQLKNEVLLPDSLFHQIIACDIETRVLTVKYIPEITIPGITPNFETKYYAYDHPKLTWYNLRTPPRPITSEEEEEEGGEEEPEALTTEPVPEPEPDVSDIPEIKHQQSNNNHNTKEENDLNGEEIIVDGNNNNNNTPSKPIATVTVTTPPTTISSPRTLSTGGGGGSPLKKPLPPLTLLSTTATTIPIDEIGKHIPSPEEAARHHYRVLYSSDGHELVSKFGIVKAYNAASKLLGIDFQVNESTTTTTTTNSTATAGGATIQGEEDNNRKVADLTWLKYDHPYITWLGKDGAIMTPKHV
jgi:hypothetical protein